MVLSNRRFKNRLWSGFGLRLQLVTFLTTTIKEKNIKRGWISIKSENTGITPILDYLIKISM